MTGWLVAVRVWNEPDQHYYAVVADRAEAEDLVRRHAVAAAAGQVSVQAVRELTADEAKDLEPGNVVQAPIDGTQT